LLSKFIELAMYFSIPELEYTLTQGNQELVPSQSWRRHFCYL